MPAGRPTKYSEEILAKAQAYLQECLDIVNSFPSVEGLSIRLGITDETVNEWTKEKPEFSAAVKVIKLLQKERLQSQGLHNRVNATMAIFLLKANHGLVDTQRTELTGKDGGAVDQNLSVTYMPDPLAHDYYAGGQQANPNNQ